MEERNRNSRVLGCRRLELVLLSATLLLTQHLASSLTVQRQHGSLPSRTGLLTRSQQHYPISSSDLSPKKAVVGQETRLFQSSRHRRSQRGDTDNESWWSPSLENSSRLKVRRRVKSALNTARGKNSRLHQSNNNNAEKTWSRASEKSSSLGVRKRVKAVLKKARSRTGVDNASEEPAGLWIAEVASIGGLAEESAWVTSTTKETNGLKVNGSANGVSTNGAVTNGAAVNGASVNGASATNGATGTVTVPPVVRTPNASSAKTFDSVSEIDGLRADVPTPPPEPLPFKLPNLSEEQRKLVAQGERVQEQSKMGREGSGFVVMDVKAPPYVVWECLLDFEIYPELIKTVRGMEMFTSNKLKAGYHEEKPVPKGSTRDLRHYGTPSVTRAAFILSKFKLNIAAIHNYRPHPEGHYMVFNLDPDCTNVVLKSATGIWYVQSNPDGKGEVRINLCEVSFDLSEMDQHH